MVGLRCMVKNQYQDSISNWKGWEKAEKGLHQSSQIYSYMEVGCKILLFLFRFHIIFGPWNVPRPWAAIMNHFFCACVYVCGEHGALQVIKTKTGRSPHSGRHRIGFHHCHGGRRRFGGRSLLWASLANPQNSPLDLSLWFLLICIDLVWFPFWIWSLAWNFMLTWEI